MQPTVRNTAKKLPVIRRQHIERFFSFIVHTHIPRILKKRSYSRNIQNAFYKLLYMWHTTRGSKLDLDKEFEVWVAATAKDMGCDRTTLYRAIKTLRKMGLIEFRGQICEGHSQFGCSMYRLGKIAKELFFWFFTEVLKVLSAGCKQASLTLRTIRRQIYGIGFYKRIFSKKAKKDKVSIKSPAIPLYGL